MKKIEKYTGLNTSVLLTQPTQKRPSDTGEVVPRVPIVCALIKEQYLLQENEEPEEAIEGVSVI